jgi:hypothetical protein
MALSVCCLVLQSLQLLPGILDFGQARVGVLPEVEDTLVLLRGLQAPFAWRGGSIWVLASLVLAADLCAG